MIATDSHFTTGSVAGSTAKAGHGMLSHGRRDTGVSPLNYRLAQHAGSVEHDILDQACARLASAGLHVPRLCVADYYVSLKTNPFVVLAGAAKAEKAAFARVFAETLVGSGNAQYVYVAGGASWPVGTGEGAYYQTLVERFYSLRLLDMMSEAAAPGNCGKAYLLCLDGMHPHELNHYFTRLLRLTPDGGRRLALPGLEPQQQPLVPANLYITAIVDTAAHQYQFDGEVLNHAGLIEVPCADEQSHYAAGNITQERPLLSQWLHGLAERHSKAPAPPMWVPPVGYQRMMIDSSIRDVETARCKLAGILGNTLGILRPSFQISRLLWQEGITLNARMLRELTRFVANSFNAHGQGLLDNTDALNNAQMALDMQVTQRLVWQLREASDAQLRNDLALHRRDVCSAVSSGGTERAALE